MITRDLDALEVSWPLVDRSDLRNDLGVLLYAMTALSARFPVIRESPRLRIFCVLIWLAVPAVSKVQKRLASH